MEQNINSQWRAVTRKGGGGSEEEIYIVIVIAISQILSIYED